MFAIKKIAMLMITMFLVSIVTFFSFSVLPGDAAVSKLGTTATPEKVQQMREEMGFDQPILIRYGKWLANAVQGDFGESYQYEGVKVSQLIQERFEITGFLAFISFLLIVIFSIPIGIFCGKNNGKWSERLVDIWARIAMAVPPFFLGVLLTFIFGMVLNIFTPGAFVFPRENFGGFLLYLLLPAIAIALPKIGMMIRITAAAIKGEQGKDYVRTAYSKGCSSQRVFWGHILKNALIPVVTYFALIVAEIIAGSIVVEAVFSVPGIGRLLVTAISNRDYPVVQGIVIWIGFVVVIINGILDMVYRRLDKRVKL